MGIAAKYFLTLSAAAILMAGSANAGQLTSQGQDPSIFPSANPLNAGTIQAIASLSRPEKPQDEAEAQRDSLADSVKNAFVARMSSDIYNKVFGDDASLSGMISISDGSSIQWVTDPVNGAKKVTIVGSTGSTTIDLPGNF